MSITDLERAFCEAIGDDELPAQGSGERGTWVIEPIDAPIPEDKTSSFDPALLTRDISRGAWRYDRAQRCLVEYTPPPKVQVHAVHQDSMDPVEYMGNANREMYDSKSALRRRYRQDGWYEMGNDRPRPSKPDPEKRRREIEDDAARAINAIKYGEAELTEWEKHQAELERRELEAYKRRQKARWA
jgi:hypothetical protein